MLVYITDALGLLSVHICLNPISFPILVPVLTLIPGVVVALVEANGVTEAAQCFLQLLGEHQLMTQQCVRVGKARVYLDGPREELNGDVMLPLQTETVSSHTPGL